MKAPATGGSAGHLPAGRDHHERASGAAAGPGPLYLCARPVVGDNPFVVVLPDIILDGGTADPLRYNLAAMIAPLNETGRSQVLAKRMPGDLRNTPSSRPKEPMVAEGQVARIVSL